jgi:NitT/TauT family transport system ATP-binding protein
MENILPYFFKGGMEMGVSIQNVAKAYDETADGKLKYVLKDINLEIASGEFICILGKSGCGKSTLLNLIAGYLKPDMGAIYVDDKEILGPDVERGVVYQQHALFPWYTVEQNIEFGLDIQKEPKKKEIVEHYLNLIGLKEYAKKYPASLSGGMAQRVGIARALANDPKVLLMDEPLGALDALTRDSMRKELVKIWKDSNKTIIFVTHSVPEAVYLADRVILLKEGNVDVIQPIDLPRPRDTKEEKFLKYVEQFEKALTDNMDENVITE